MAPGQTNTVTREFNISQAGKFRFEVRTVDALDNTVSFDSNEISIGYQPPTPAPTQQAQPTVAPVVTYSPIPVSGDDSILSKGKNALFILTAAVGVLLAGSLALFLISSFIRARTRRQSDTAYDHLEIQPKRDYADPDTYQGEDDARQAQDKPDGKPEEISAPVARQVKEEDLPHHKYLNEDSPKAEPVRREGSVQTLPDDTGDSASESDISEEGAYQMVREPKDAGSQTPVPQQRKPRRRAAKTHQLPEDEE